MATMLVTGGGGFIGSHAAEYFAQRGYTVRVFDNLSRSVLLKNNEDLNKNWYYLKTIKTITLIKGDIRDAKAIEKAAKGCDVIVHAAAQTAVTVSLQNPAEDFSVNALGTFNTLEAARKNKVKTFIYCSTNKVFGDNVNTVPVKESGKRYSFGGAYTQGIPSHFSIDHCEHTPYGSSKLTGDIYVQDYSHLYGLRCGIFRMSCIYGTRQYGVADQGWLSWFVKATVLNKPLTIYGDGKQVRDVLFITDLLVLYEQFIKSTLTRGVYSVGGGSENTLSLLELLDLLKKETGKLPPISYAPWRPSDQKVFIADISELQTVFGWKPKVGPVEGVKKLITWTKEDLKIK